MPVHCHGNHWTLAVVNFKLKRFEYYDSLRGPPEATLDNLRRWVCDESLDKKQTAYDLSGVEQPSPPLPLLHKCGTALSPSLVSTGWTDVAHKSGTPEQRNGYDCGVFMTRTAEYLARDGVLDFSQASRVESTYSAPHCGRRSPPHRRLHATSRRRTWATSAGGWCSRSCRWCSSPRSRMSRE